ITVNANIVDIPTIYAQFLLRDSTGRLVGRDADLQPRRQPKAEDRLIDHVDGQVHRSSTRGETFRNARLPDTGKPGYHDESTGHATSRGVIVATVSRSARRSIRSS